MAKSNIDILSQQLFDIHNFNCNIKDRELYLHGHYGSGDNDEPGVEYRMATTFIKNLNFLNTISNDTIIVYSHTIGGECADGMAIYDAILHSKSYIIIVAYAHARSMSSIIFQAADTRILMPNSYFMIHYGTISQDATYSQCLSSIKFAEQDSQRMLDIYATKCLKTGKFWKKNNINTIDECSQYLHRQMCEKGDFYMTPEEAVYYGFADGILGDEKYPSIDSLKGLV